MQTATQVKFFARSSQCSCWHGYARILQCRSFLMVVLTATALSSTSLLADNFRQAAPGIYVRIGEHREISPESGGLQAPSQRPGIANIGFIVGQKSVAVIDPGGSDADAELLSGAISRRTSLPVSHVILTHFHPDHVLAGQYFAHVPQVIAHRRYAAAMAQRGEHYAARFSALLGSTDGVAWLMPTVEVSDTLNIDLGNRELLIRAHDTAHTDNDISVFDSDTGTLWLSDLAFAQRIPILDGSLRGWLQVLTELQVPVPELVIPGHGNPGRWSQVVEPQLRYLQTLLSSTRDAIARGLSLTGQIAEIDYSRGADWLMYERFHPRNVTRAYAELEWE